MYGYNLFSRGFSLVRILNGLSKGLNIANQVIPIYNKAKPMVSNTKNIFKTIKNINIINNSTDNKNIKKEPLKDSLNNPKFFI